MKRLFITVSAALLCSACGGGGGGSTNPATNSDTYVSSTQFNKPTQIDSDVFAISAVGDFNSDGLEDLVVAYATDNRETVELMRAGKPIKIFLQEGGTLVDRTVELLGTIPSVAFARHIEVADFNGDHYDDIYFGNALETSNVPYSGDWYEKDVYLLSNGAGGYTNVIDTNTPSLYRLDLTDPTRDLYTHGVDSADIDGDGDVDLVLNVVWSGLHVLENDGYGVFTLKQTYPQANLWALFIKANSDIYPDLFVGDGTNYAQHQILLNDGSGSFGAETVALPVPLLDGLVEDAHVLNVDGDGADDLLIGNTSSDFTAHGAQLLVNRTILDGMFTDDTAERFSSAPSPVDNYNPYIYVRDLNNDGYEDVVMVTKDIYSGLSGTNVYLNQNYSFVKVDDVPTLTGALALIDLDDDSDIDVVVSDSYEISPTVWKSGTFILKAKQVLQ